MSKSSKASPTQLMKAAEFKLKSCEKFRTTYNDKEHSISRLSIQAEALNSLQIQYESAFDQCLDGIDDNQLDELAKKREDFNDRWCDLSSWIQDEINRRSPLQSNVGKLNETNMSVDSSRASHKQRAEFYAKQLAQYEAFRRDFGDQDQVVNIYELRTRLKALEPLREKYEAEMLEYIEELNDEDERKEAKSSFEAVSRRFFDVVAWFVEQVEKQSKPRAEATTTTTSARRPKIDNPTFDGKAVNWLAFHDLYSELLRKSIQLPQGEINVLDGIPFGADHYQTAWEAICARYSDKRKIIAAHYDLLMNVEPMTKESAEELRRIIDSFATNFKALANIGFKLEDKFSNSLVVHIMVSRLDKQTLKEWKKSTTDESSTYDSLNEFLLKQWKSLSDLPSQIKSNYDSSSHSKTGRTHTAVSDNVKSSSKCHLCTGPHWVNHCEKFLSMSPESRLDFIKSTKLCVNCFSSKHDVGQCTRHGRCSECGGQHHTTVHTQESRTKVEKPQTSESPGLKLDSKPFVPFAHHGVTNLSLDTGRTFSAAAADLFAHRRSLLTTAQVDVLSSEKGVSQCRVLLDSGSNTNYVSAALVKRLNLPVFEIAMRVEGIDAKPTIVRQGTVVKLRSRYGNYEVDAPCAVLQKITGTLQTNIIDRTEINLPRQTFLADPTFHATESVDLLLGNVIDNEVKLDGKIKLQDDLTMNHTKFGWTISGSMACRPEEPIQATYVSRSSLMSTCRSTLSLEEQKRQLENLSKQKEVGNELMKKKVEVDSLERIKLDVNDTKVLQKNQSFSSLKVRKSTKQVQGRNDVTESLMRSPPNELSIATSEAEAHCRWKNRLPSGRVFQRGTS
jgi:hypothetical protein